MKNSIQEVDANGFSQLIPEFLSFVCSNKWEDFITIKGETKCKFCKQCQKNVHLVDSTIDFEENKVLGNCVFISQKGWFMLTGLVSSEEGLRGTPMT